MRDGTEAAQPIVWAEIDKNAFTAERGGFVAGVVKRRSMRGGVVRHWEWHVSRKDYTGIRIGSRRTKDEALSTAAKHLAKMAAEFSCGSAAP